MAARAIDWSWVEFMEPGDWLAWFVFIVGVAALGLWFLDRVVFRSKYER